MEPILVRGNHVGSWALRTGFSKEHAFHHCSIHQVFCVRIGGLPIENELVQIWGVREGPLQDQSLELPDTQSEIV